MKKFTSFCKRCCMVAALFMGMTTTAFAEPDNYYHWFYDVFTAYPSGAGKVYVENQETATSESAADVPADAWKESLDFKTKTFGQGTAYVNAFNQPAEGWVFIGWSDRTDSILQSASDYLDYGMIALTSKTQAESDEEDLTPFVPDSTILGLFSHVTASVDANCTLFGSVSVSPLVNDINDEVTLTATPNETYKATFDYWLGPDGETQIKDATLKLTVTEAANYTAFFHSEAIETIPATASGYQILFLDKNAKVVDETTQVMTLNTYDLMKDKISYYDDSKYIWGQTPTIVNAWTDIQVLPLEEEVYPSENPGWTGDESKSVSDLDGSMTYYQVVLPGEGEWEVKLTRLAADATIPAKTMYVGFSNESIEAMGGMDDVLTLVLYDPDGVSSVKAANTASDKVYDLQGRRVSDMNRGGLYIVNGKKIVVKK